MEHEQLSRAEFEAQVDCYATRNERACYMCLEYGERWDEHFVDDVQNPVVCIHVRSNHVSAVDFDAFSHHGGHRVRSDIV